MRHKENERRHCTIGTETERERGRRPVDNIWTDVNIVNVGVMVGTVCGGSEGALGR